MKTFTVNVGRDWKNSLRGPDEVTYAIWGLQDIALLESFMRSGQNLIFKECHVWTYAYRYRRDHYPYGGLGMEINVRHRMADGSMICEYPYFEEQQPEESLKEFVDRMFDFAYDAWSLNHRNELL